jgi:hypothetical protein
MTTTPTTIPAAGAAAAGAVDEKLSTRRLNVMRFGYAFMGVGLAIVKWPFSSRSHPFHAIDSRLCLSREE